MKKINVALALWALLSLTGCAKKEEKEAEPVVPVQVTAARSDSIRRLVEADGILYPRNQASVVPKISAPVRVFHVNRGDHVREGQLLALLENRDLAAAAEESKGQWNQAEANYRSTASATVPEEVVKAQTDVQSSKEAMDAAQKVLDSRQKLFKEGALARKLVDDAQVAYVQAHSQFEAAQQHLEALQSVGKQEQIKGAAAQVDTAKAHYQGAEAQLSYSEIRSPISGVIADRAVYPGEMAAAGSPLLTVMDVSSVVARANIPQGQAGGLRVGSPATVKQNDSGQELQGKVIVVSPAVDPNSTTVQVWVETANPGERLKPGVTVHVSIVAAVIPNAVVIPPAALLPAADGSTQVIVVGSDAVAHTRKVETGAREADKVQIVSGLKSGEQVITVGGLGVDDGTKVQVAKPGEKPAAGEKEES
ncbi:MAG TPA: efflux RND transporter periplasmic adaptor subunit [Bryobacteraceae bacterium]|nr:efflux RND transporter periplasmic adaptor subunit [Bryobacteraceae bacterium]